MPLKVSQQWSSSNRIFTRRQSAGDDDDDDDDDNSSHSHQNTDGSRHSTSSTSSLPLPSGANHLTLENKSNSGAIAGGVIGGLCGLALIVFFWWWWRRRKYRSRSHALVDLDEEPKSQATSVTHSKELDQFLATPFIHDADNRTASEARTVYHNQGESYNQDQFGFNEAFQARNVSASQNTPSTHVQRIVSNPDSALQDDDYATPPSLSQTAFIAHQKRSLDADHSTGPSSWKRAESQITRSKTFHTTSESSQGSEGGFNVNNSSSSSFSRRSFDGASTTTTQVTSFDSPSRGEKRPPPEVRLSVEGLFVDGRRVPDTGNNDRDEVVNLQRRIEALTQENALLALHAEAPPAYQGPGERSGPLTR